MPKILDESANVLALTIVEVEVEHRSDGYVSPEEEYVELSLRYSLALMQQAIGREKLSTRVGNGMLTKALLAEIREYDEELRQIREAYPLRTGYTSSEEQAA